MSRDLGAMLLAGWHFQVSLDAGSYPTEVFDVKGGKGAVLPVDSPRYLRIAAKHRHFHEGGATFGLDYAVPSQALTTLPAAGLERRLHDCWSALARKIKDIRPDLLQEPEAA